MVAASTCCRRVVAVSIAAVSTVLAGSISTSVRVTQLFELAEGRRSRPTAIASRPRRRKIDADRQKEQLRRYLFAADMPRAYKAYQQNNVVQMHEILARHIGAPEKRTCRIRMVFFGSPS